MIMIFAIGVLILVQKVEPGSNEKIIITITNIIENPKILFFILFFPFSSQNSNYANLTKWTLIGRKTASGSSNAISIGNHNLYLVVVSMSSGSQLLMPMIIPKAALSSAIRHIAVYGESGNYHVYLGMSLTTVYVFAVSEFTLGYIEVYGQ